VCQLMGAGQEPIIRTAKRVIFLYFSCSIVYKDYVLLVLTCLKAASRRISLIIVVAFIYVKLIRNIFNLLKLLKNVDFNLSQ